ncbi:MAG: hypothetical protein ACE5EU_08140 [Paracoccaceae bacterium]
MQPVETKTGAALSGAMHLGILALALLGTDWLTGRDPAPLAVTEVELIEGVDFEAALSTAPVVPNEGPAELAPQAETDLEAIDIAEPDVTIEAPVMPLLAETEVPPDERPDAAALLIPPPPTVVPTEAPRPSIALIPSPDPLARQAEEPESPRATEVVQPLAAAPVPEPAPRPAMPEPEPVIAEPATAEAPRPALAPVPSPHAPPRLVAEPESPPETDPLQPLGAAPPPEPRPEEPRHEPEPELQPEPEPVAVAEPAAPVSPAPREARLPVAKPAERAAAARASSAPEPVAAAPEPAEEPEPAQPAGGSTSQFAVAVTEGEKEALRLGIKRHFYYRGSRADRSLQVTIRIRLGRDAKIIGRPELLRASGGTEAAQNALFQDGRRALLKAQNAGEFRKLPLEKYDGWKLIHVTFTPEEIGFSS